MKTKIRQAVELAYERGYRVTDEGELVSFTGRKLSCRRNGKQRYPTFSLNRVFHLVPSGTYGIPVHIFAAFCFYGESTFQENLVVRHLDADTENIAKSNIVLGTYSENERDKDPQRRSNAARIARAAQEGPFNAKLTPDNVRQIRILLDSDVKASDIARSFGVSKWIISMVKHGKTYKDVV